MNYLLRFSKRAEEDLIYHKKSGDKVILKKITLLLNEIAFNPYTGTGKPEALKHDFTGKLSRRINGKHRLVYEVFDIYIKIFSAKGHYN